MFGPRVLLFGQAQVLQDVRDDGDPRRSRRRWRKLQPGGQVHHLADGQQRLMKIVLGYVARPFVEFALVSRSACHQELSSHTCRSEFWFVLLMLLKIGIVSSVSAYLYPEIAFKRLLFPAPDGPIIAESWPEANFPLTDFMIVFLSDLIVLP